MSGGLTWIAAFCAATGVVAFVETFLAVPMSDRVFSLIGDSRKAFAVIRSKRISDHWKEAVLPRYAVRILVSTLLVLCFLLLCCAAFLLVYLSLGRLLTGDFGETYSLLFDYKVQGVALAVGILYGVIRKKISSPSAKDYSLSSKVLHYLAFAGPGVQEIAFDLDCSLGGRQPAQGDHPSPVYISGLARAGTTLLLEAIYSTGAFATLTYRNMPFVTAPLLWSRMSRGRTAGENPLRERAHGDKVLVNYDSPEAFEEVFWLAFMKNQYVEENGLRYHDVDDGILGKYARFVANVVRSEADRDASRYLAKNNNNMLRIDAIRKAFPSSVIIVPFRNPLDHARSLKRQHESFLARHEEDPFSMRYMGWLGHFEFGRHFKPFLADSEAVPVDWEETRRLSFWIRYWKSVYQHAVETMTDKVVFFDYDGFCQNPKGALANLERKLGMAADSLTPYSVHIRRPTRYSTTDDDGAVSDDVRMVYEKLKESM